MIEKLTEEEIEKLKKIYQRNSLFIKPLKSCFSAFWELVIYIIVLGVHISMIDLKTGDRSLYCFLLFYILAIRTDRNQARIKAIASTYRKLNNKDFASMQKFILDIAKVMNIQGEINIFYSRSNHFIPNIFTATDKEVYLILPRNLVTLFTKNIVHFEAIIAHEFGHVLQKDTQLWWDESKTQELIWIAILAHLAYFSTFSSMNMYYLLLFFLFFNIIYFKPRFRRKRYNSEFNADLASIVYTGHLGIVDVLNSNYIINTDTYLHPSSGRRVTFILKCMSKINR